MNKKLGMVMKMIVNEDKMNVDKSKVLKGINDIKLNHRLKKRKVNNSALSYCIYMK